MYSISYGYVRDFTWHYINMYNVLIGTMGHRDKLWLVLFKVSRLYGIVGIVNQPLAKVSLLL